MDELFAGLGEVARGRRSMASWLGLPAGSLARVLSLGIAKMAGGRDREAVRVLRGLVVLEPRCAAFRMYLGVALERSRELDAAIDQYTQALALTGEPDQRGELHVLRAFAKARQGDRIGARSDLSEARGHAAALDAAWSRKLARLVIILGDTP